MPRCVTLAATALAISALAGPAFAQLQRSFPATALRGELQIVQPPEAVLNGRAARIAPGVRIRGADNLLKVSGAVAGQRLLVHYTLDNGGLIRDVWVLRPDEAAKQPWPSTREQAATWIFDPMAQTWSKP